MEVAEGREEIDARPSSVRSHVKCNFTRNTYFLLLQWKELISFISRLDLASSLFPVLLLHPGHQLCAAVRLHRLQPVQPGVDHVPAAGHHVQDHPQVPGPLRAGQRRQEAAGEDDQVGTLINRLPSLSPSIYLLRSESRCLHVEA